MPMLKKIIIMIKKITHSFSRSISVISIRKGSLGSICFNILTSFCTIPHKLEYLFFFFNSPKITIKSEKWKIIQKSKSKNDPIQELTNIYIKEIYELTSCNRRGRWRGTAALSWLPCGHLLFSILKNWLFLTTSSHGTLASSLWFFALVNDAAKF